jgi:UDP-2,3-diacylglucosamine pyrophosphatase LpxH
MSKNKRSYRSIFISDIHLGSGASKVDLLLKFLDKTKCEYLYICGDFIDFLHLYEHHGWSRNCNLLMRKILSKVKKGTQIKICIGNHDAFLGIISSFEFGNIQIAHHFIHENQYIDYLVIHGDKFDKAMKCEFLAKAVAFLYNHMHSFSLVQFIKRRVDRWMENQVDKKSMLEFAKGHGADGVIYGHTHKPKIKPPYLNCGDWVEHCTAIVEDFDGEFKIVNVFGEEDEE